MTCDEQGSNAEGTRTTSGRTRVCLTGALIAALAASVWIMLCANVRSYHAGDEGVLPINTSEKLPATGIWFSNDSDLDITADTCLRVAGKPVSHSCLQVPAGWEGLLHSGSLSGHVELAVRTRYSLPSSGGPTDRASGHDTLVSSGVYTLGAEDAKPFLGWVKFHWDRTISVLQIAPPPDRPPWRGRRWRTVGRPSRGVVLESTADSTVLRDIIVSHRGGSFVVDRLEPGELHFRPLPGRRAVGCKLTVQFCVGEELNTTDWYREYGGLVELFPSDLFHVKIPWPD